MKTTIVGGRGDETAACRCDQHVASGIRLIMEEQLRQKIQAVSSPEQDEYWAGNLALVAACYAEFASLPGSERIELTEAKDQYWPWDEEWWKPVNPLQDLVHAGALIAAEIDRLLNAKPLATDSATER